MDEEILAEVTRAATELRPARRDYLVQRFEDAVTAFDRGRVPEASRLLGPLVQDLPGVAPVRQLAGLAAYRDGRWRDAVRHLEAYERTTGDPSVIPLVMDGYRALGRRRRVADRWNDLRRLSPEPDVLAEARIVAAGSLADAGDLSGAISLMTAAGSARRVRNPAERHLRQWYVLADLYERAGDVPRARDLFGRLEQADPEFFDVAGRRATLGRTPRSRGARTG